MPNPAEEALPYRPIADFKDAWFAVEAPPGDIALREDVPVELKEKVDEMLLRAAAFETGAIEGLYKSGPGMTLLVASAEAGWEEAVNDAGARGAFTDQHAAYLAVRDYVQKTDVPVGKHLLRYLHQTACGNQVTLDNGRPFEHGAFKAGDNYAEDRFGRRHMYCPHLLVGSELDSAFDIYHQLLGLGTSPIILSAFLHWAIAHVHPFDDGNGRVARVLASIPTMELAGMPLMVYADRRAPYLQALDAADEGQVAAMVRFTADRLSSLSGWVKDLYAAERSIEANSDISSAILRLMRAQEEPAEPAGDITRRVRQVFIDNLRDELSWLTSVQGELVLVSDDNVFSMGGDNAIGVHVALKIRAPLPVTSTGEYSIVISRDPQKDIEVWSGRGSGTKKVRSFRYSDCTPSISSEGVLVLSSFARAQARKLGDELMREASATAEARGTRPAKDQ